MDESDDHVLEGWSFISIPLKHAGMISDEALRWDEVTSSVLI